MADEAEARAAEAAARHGVHAEVFHVHGYAFLAGLLPHDAVVVRGAGGLEMHGGGFAEVVEPVQHFFVFFGGDHLFLNFGGPAHGHEQEDVPGHGADFLAQVEDILERVQVALGHRGVDLEFHAFGLQVFDAAHGGVEGSGHAAEGVVACGVGSVDGDGAALEAGFLYLAGGLGRDERAVRRHDAAQALVAGVGGEFIDVGAHHGIAAGEDDDGLADFGEGVDEGPGFRGGELARIGFGMSFGAAVLAGQVAGTGDFPGDEAALGRAVGQEAGFCRGGMPAGGSVGNATHGMPAGMAGPQRGEGGVVAVHQRIHPSRRASTVK